MRRKTAFILLAGAAAIFGVPNTATAQLSVGVHLYWEWSDGAWQPHRYDWDAGRRAYRLDRRGGWIAAAYLPPRGYCREWIPGLPAWRQPRPVPCDRLFLRYGYDRPGVIILGSVGFAGPVARMDRDDWRDRVDWGRRYVRVEPYRPDRDDRARRVDRDDRGDRGERGNRGRGREESRGRGNRDHDRRGRGGG